MRAGTCDSVPVSGRLHGLTSDGSELLYTWWRARLQTWRNRYSGPLQHGTCPVKPLGKFPVPGFTGQGASPGVVVGGSFKTCLSNICYAAISMQNGIDAGRKANVSDVARKDLKRSGSKTPALDLRCVFRSLATTQSRLPLAPPDNALA